MGIHDREYYRDSTRGNWLSGAAPMCKALILVNVGVYVAQVIFPLLGLEEAFAVSGDLVFRKFQLWRLVTAAFLHSHGSPFHLLFNMGWLWMIGREVEAIYGRLEFLGMYLAAAALSFLAWAGLATFGGGDPRGLAIGASGAVMAVMMIYTLYNPHHEVTLFFVLPIEMWMLMLMTLGIDFLFLLQERSGAAPVGIAFAAHLGGAAYGYLYKTYNLQWTRLLGTRRRGPRLRVVQPDSYDRGKEPVYPASTPRMAAAAPVARPAPLMVQADEVLDARVDEILRKINREGNRDGLTDEEKGILQEASRRARDRRADRVR